MISKDIESVLDEIIPACALLHFDYVFVGRTALVLQGIDVPISDVDIATHKEGVFGFAYTFNKYVLTPPCWSETQQMAGYFSQYIIQNVLVEIMGETHNKISGQLLPYNPIKHTTPVIFKGNLISTMQLEDQLITNLLLERFDRVEILFEETLKRGYDKTYLKSISNQIPLLTNIIQTIVGRCES